MRTKRWLWVLVAATLVALLAASVGVSARTLRWAHVYAPDHPFHTTALMVAKEVQQRTNGGLVLQVFPAAQLGSEKDIVEGMAVGTIDMVIAGPGELGKWYKPLLVFDAAFVFRDADHAERVVSGPIGQELYEGLRKAAGFRVLGTWYYGTRHITANRPIRSPTDLRGVKLRVPDMPMSVANARAMGANPTPMALSEVYLALQLGAVDGQENPIATIASMKFHEVQKYLVLTGHVVQLTPVAIGETVWASLSPAEQQALAGAVQQHTATARMLIEDYETYWMGQFEKRGMQIIRDADIPAFRKAGSGVVPQFESQWGKGLYERIQGSP